MRHDSGLELSYAEGSCPENYNAACLDLVPNGFKLICLLEINSYE
jgi:hypothetical protein